MRETPYSLLCGITQKILVLDWMELDQKNLAKSSASGHLYYVSFDAIFSIARKSLIDKEILLAVELL